MNPSPFTLEPQYREYVWGGSKLRPAVVPTAEAWAVYENNRVSCGEYAGATLAELTRRFGAELLGARAANPTGGRFPVLVKLLDCAQWLSLQVHPNDEQARRLEGEGFFGKTEAWHVLEAEPEARLLAGLKPGVQAEEIRRALRSGEIVELTQSIAPRPGDTLFMSPGTLHALGPGLLIYEIQQTSDVTYRAYDWGRPQTETRQLHIEKALQVINPAAAAALLPDQPMRDGEIRTLTRCEYFQLEKIAAEEKPVALNTRGESFHALTVVEGRCEIRAGGEVFPLEKFQTLFVPALRGEYQIVPLKKSRLLSASA